MSVLAKPYVERDGSEIVTYDGFAVEYRDVSHSYWIHQDGERRRAVSVTSALRVLDKPALVSWAERCGVEGALELERGGQLQGVSIKDATAAMRTYGLGAGAMRKTGADRGTAVHTALQRYCSEGTVPSLADFPADVRGYVQAACSWLVQTQPEPVLIEQIIGSPVHGYAGRFDLIARIQTRTLLVDLKTNPSARIFDEAHAQTAGYLAALPECGIEGVEGAIIVALGENGEHRVGVCEAEPSDFLSILDTYRRVARIRSARQAKERAEREAA